MHGVGVDLGGEADDEEPVLTIVLLEEELSAELRTKLMDGIGDLSDSVQQIQPAM